MSKMFYIFSVIAIAYAIMVWVTIKRIMNIKLFSKRQKILNMIMTILFPMIWIPLIFTLIKPDPSIFELKEMRDWDKKDLSCKDPQGTA
jgi:hypothetical protein